MEDSVIYRWYWFVKMKKDGREKWVATCYSANSIKEADDIAEHEMYLADVGSKQQKLVKETTSYIDCT